MLSQPNLSQSKQPKNHYDYDGLSGGWLWFPWWVHLILAILLWPVCWWLLPKLPFQNSNITDFLFNYRLKLAIFLSISTCVTAVMSFLKARKIQLRKFEQPKKIAVQERTQQKEEKSVKTVTVKRDTKNSTKKTEKLLEVAKVETVSKKEKVKTVVKPKKNVKAKATTEARSATKKKKDESQLRLDF